MFIILSFSCLKNEISFGETMYKTSFKIYLFAIYSKEQANFFLKFSLVSLNWKRNLFQTRPVWTTNSSDLINLFVVYLARSGACRNPLLDENPALDNTDLGEETTRTHITVINTIRWGNLNWETLPDIHFNYLYSL